MGVIIHVQLSTHTPHKVPGSGIDIENRKEMKKSKSKEKERKEGKERTNGWREGRKEKGRERGVK